MPKCASESAQEISNGRLSYGKITWSSPPNLLILCWASERVGSMGPPAASAIRAQLSKIVASPGFVHAERLRRFLTLTVEMTLDGKQEQIKEFLIGREVFDRNGEYDPRLDPIVRVEARRLRSRLREYYEVEGLHDPVR